MAESQAPLYFASAQDSRGWLKANATASNELIVGFHKIDGSQYKAGTQGRTNTGENHEAY